MTICVTGERAARGWGGGGGQVSTPTEQSASDPSPGIQGFNGLHTPKLGQAFEHVFPPPARSAVV